MVILENFITYKTIIIFSTHPKLSLRHVNTFIEKRKIKTKCFPCLLERNFTEKRVPNQNDMVNISNI